MKAINMALYMKERRKTRRNKLIEMFGGCCSECGTTENLEFNHIDRTTRSFVLSGCYLDRPWNKILDEAKKCELLCKAHHVERTREQYATGQIIQHNSKKHLPYEHGTMRMYQEMHCRCDDCKYAKKLYRSKKTTYSEIIHSRRSDFGVSDTDC